MEATGISFYYCLHCKGFLFGARGGGLTDFTCRKCGAWNQLEREKGPMRFELPPDHTCSLSTCNHADDNQDEIALQAKIAE